MNKILNHLAILHTDMTLTDTFITNILPLTLGFASTFLNE
jgi:hypothetical protein